MKARVIGELEHVLSDRDWLILSSVQGFRFLTTRQIARQHFGHEAGPAPIPRNANQNLSRLRDLGLLSNLERRIGGVRAGSAGFVWQLTELGDRALHSHLGRERQSRMRPYEPSTSFLDHTLAIAEVVITLQEISRSAHVGLSHLQLEPECWRSYVGPSGETRTLKPDVVAVTESSGFEDHWFIEVDRATEPPNRVVKKCLQYQEYRVTGHEQARVGLFPAVVWAVPNERRRDQLTRRLHRESAIDPRLFSVVTTPEIKELVVSGAAQFRRRRGEAI